MLKIKLTEDHKPDLSRIKSRVENNGGLVINLFGRAATVNAMLTVGGALGDNNLHGFDKNYHSNGKDVLLRTPDVFTFKPDTAEYEKLQQVCKQEGIADLQQTIKENKVRLVFYSDGVDAFWDQKAYSPKCDYQATWTEENGYELQKCSKNAKESDLSSTNHDYFEKNCDFIFDGSKPDSSKMVASIDDVTVISFNPNFAQNGKTTTIGVFDGHGGSAVADFAHKELPVFIGRQIAINQAANTQLDSASANCASSAHQQMQQG